MLGARGEGNNPCSGIEKKGRGGTEALHGEPRGEARDVGGSITRNGKERFDSRTMSLILCISCSSLRPLRSTPWCSLYSPCPLLFLPLCAPPPPLHLPPTFPPHPPMQDPSPTSPGGWFHERSHSREATLHGAAVLDGRRRVGRSLARSAFLTASHPLRHTTLRPAWPLARPHSLNECRKLLHHETDAADISALPMLHSFYSEASAPSVLFVAVASPLGAPLCPANIFPRCSFTPHAFLFYPLIPHPYGVCSARSPLRRCVCSLTSPRLPSRARPSPATCFAGGRCRAGRSSCGRRGRRGERGGRGGGGRTAGHRHRHRQLRQQQRQPVAEVVGGRLAEWGRGQEASEAPGLSGRKGERVSRASNDAGCYPMKG